MLCSHIVSPFSSEQCQLSRHFIKYFKQRVSYLSVGCCAVRVSISLSGELTFENVYQQGVGVLCVRSVKRNTQLLRLL